MTTSPQSFPARSAPRVPLSFLAGLRRLLVCGGAVSIAALMVGGCVADGNTGPTVKKDYSFWPSPPLPPHVQFLKCYNSSEDLVAKRSNFDEMLYGKEGEKLWPIGKPYGVRMYDGKMYICDTGSSNVSIFDLRKKEVRLLGASGKGALAKPIDIVIAPDGTKYVCDTQKAAVQVYSAADAYLGDITVEDMRPVALALYGNELYVADFKHGHVVVFDRTTRKVIRIIGEPGSKPGQTGGIFGLAVDKDGNLYTSRFVNCRIQKFNHDGKLVLSFGEVGRTVGSLAQPKHITLDAEGRIYVVDAAFQNVQVFDPEGNLLLYFGGGGEFDGAMFLPAGICVVDQDLDLFAPFMHAAFQPQRLIIVTNQFGPAKVSVYAMGELKAGKTVADLVGAIDTSAAGVSDARTAPKDVDLSKTPEDVKRHGQGALAPATVPATNPATVPATAPGTAPATELKP